jgi:hypothetical protein
MAGQPGFFDRDERLKALSAAGDPLERLSRVVDFEVFRGELEAGLSRSDLTKGGRPLYDPVLMFKAANAVRAVGRADRISAQGLPIVYAVCRLGAARDGARCLYREQLARAGAVERPFARSDALLRVKGWLAMSGQIVDATVIEARRLRLTQAEKDTLKGRRPTGSRHGGRRSTATGAGH